MLQDYAIEQLNYGRKVYDFMSLGVVSFGISLLLLTISLTTILTRGFNWGLDFTGGTVIELNLKKPINLNIIRQCLGKAGFQGFIIQKFGSSRDIIVRIPQQVIGVAGQGLGNKVINVIKDSVDNCVTVRRIECVGPSVGRELSQDGSVALLVALICILIYVGCRFEWRLALGVVIALAHDVAITLGVLSLFYIEIDLTIIASLMSVIGYSLNDSIVVSDRIRENFRKIAYGTPYDIINVSLTQTLIRTLITSGTTLLVVFMLYIFGGMILHAFALAMLIGVSIGTLSSIYVASTLALKLGMKREYML